MKSFIKLIAQIGIVSIILSTLYVLSATLVAIIPLTLEDHELVDVLKNISLEYLLNQSIQITPFIFTIIMITGFFRFIFMKLIK
jgi:hypothetical protein